MIDCRFNFPATWSAGLRLQGRLLVRMPSGISIFNLDSGSQQSRTICKPNLRESGLNPERLPIAPQRPWWACPRLLIRPFRRTLLSEYAAPCVKSDPNKNQAQDDSAGTQSQRHDVRGLLRALHLNVAQACNVPGLRGRKYRDRHSEYSKKDDNYAQPYNRFHQLYILSNAEP